MRGKPCWLPWSCCRLPPSLLLLLRSSMRPPHRWKKFHPEASDDVIMARALAHTFCRMLPGRPTGVERLRPEFARGLKSCAVAGLGAPLAGSSFLQTSWTRCDLPMPSELVDRRSMTKGRFWQVLACLQPWRQGCIFCKGSVWAGHLAAPARGGGSQAAT